MSREGDDADRSFAPRQARSRDTAARLLAATVEILREVGLEGCTVPAVAARAGVAVGTVYRRYPDKERLVAEAILSLFALFDEEGEADVIRMVDGACSLEALIQALVSNTAGMVIANRILLLAARDFARSSADPDFQRALDARRGQPREVLVRAIWRRFGPEIEGGETALRTALAAVHGAVHIVYVEAAPGLFATPPEPAQFAVELARMQAAYLRPVSK